MADDDTTEIPLSSDNLSYEYTFMDPDYLAMLREDFDITTGRGGVLWNTFMYGVEYDPTEEIFTDPDGNIVEGGPMIPNPDYVPATGETTAPNPEHRRWEYLRPDERERTPEPPREITVPGTPAQGEEFIVDPSVTLTPTTRGAVEEYNPDEHFSEYEGMVLGFAQQQGLIPARTETELAGLTEQRTTSELGTATAESALRLLPEEEKTRLLELGADASGYDLTTAENLSALRLLPEEEKTKLMALGAEQSGYDLSRETSEMGLRLLPQQEQALSAGFTADTATANERTATANRAIDLIRYGEEQGLGEAEIDAQLAQAGFTKADADYAKELLNYRRSTGVDTAGIDFEKQSIMDRSLALTQRAPVREAMFNQALEGMDTEKYARQAGATASGDYDASKEGLNRQLQRRGVNPGAITTDDSMERASVISNAKTGARNWAEQESFNRLNTALNNTGA